MCYGFNYSHFHTINYTKTHRQANNRSPVNVRGPPERTGFVIDVTEGDGPVPSFQSFEIDGVFRLPLSLPQELASALTPRKPSFF